MTGKLTRSISYKPSTVFLTRCFSPYPCVTLKILYMYPLMLADETLVDPVTLQQKKQKKQQKNSWATEIFLVEQRLVLFLSNSCPILVQTILFSPNSTAVILSMTYEKRRCRDG